MTLPVNILQQVITYNESELAFLLNLNCFLNTANMKFKDFENRVGNLGDTVNFDLMPRATSSVGLVADFQPAVQRVQALQVDQALNSSMAFTSQQFIFQAREYMEKFNRARMYEIAAQIESNIALNAVSGVPVYTVNSQGQSVPSGALHTESGPFRFYGDGVTPINSFGQLALMVARFRNFGFADPVDVYLDDITVPQICNSGLNQFVLDRNEEIANSWNLGSYPGSNARYYQSNLLPTHTSGNVGVNGTVLTVLSTNDPTGANITQITFSGAGTNDSSAIFSGDLAQFQDGVSGQPNLRFLTFTGHVPSQSYVQFRATANAASDGSGHVTVNIYPPLQSTPGINQNLTNNIVAGMQVKFLPSHRAGLIVGNKALFVAMPRLPDERPYDSSTTTDEETGASLRLYYGSLFGQNQRGLITDCIWGSTLVPEDCMRIIIPL